MKGNEVNSSTIYVLLHPELGVKTECTEKYLDSWTSRGFIVVGIKQGSIL